MRDQIQRSELVQMKITRRGLVANIKAIGAITTVAVVANLARLTPAMAQDHNGGDHHGGGHPLCFLRGTRIKTVSGEQKVEDLAVGDLLPTVFGGARPIQWIARYQYKKHQAGKPWKKALQPVRVASSAISPNIPHTDLYVTQGHALLIDGVLIPAGSLVNGTTIALCDASEFEELEFFQIKLETHDVIYAEGAACETLLRVEENAINFNEYRREHGTVEVQDTHCAPVFCNGARSEIKSRVRSMMSPWFGPEKVDIIRTRLEARAIALLTSSVPGTSPSCPSSAAKKIAALEGLAPLTRQSDPMARRKLHRRGADNRAKRHVHGRDGRREAQPNPEESCSTA